MTDKAIKPEDILGDDENILTIQGIRVRKGTIAAAMRNMVLLAEGTPPEREAALAMLRELAPGLVVLGMHRHFLCRNPEVERILADAAARLAEESA